MKIQVNGKPRTTSTGVTVGDLLRELGISPERVAVEINYEVVDLRELGRRWLREGDRVEIIGFFGGGTASVLGPLVWKRGESWITTNSSSLTVNSGPACGSGQGNTRTSSKPKKL